MTDDNNPVVGKPKSRRGFASWSPEKRLAAQSKGGKSVKPENRFFSQEPEEARAAGRKGLETMGKKTSD